MASEWTLIGSEGPRPRCLDPDDVCFSAREYISHGGYSAGETNNLVSNLKKEMSKRQLPEWRYKLDAIEAFARELIGVVQPGQTLCAMPPSRAWGDPEYDPRLHWVLEALQAKVSGLSVVNPVVRVTSAEPSHTGGTRSVEEIVADLKWKGLPSETDLLIVVDDVITTGAHFKAFKTVIAENSPATDVGGVFWARTVHQQNATEWSDLDDGVF